jgi:putative AdoMet-dependent methyltransferase
MDIDFYLDYSNAVYEARGPAWRYDEMKSCGADFNSFFVARGYDKYHQTFRDYRREAEQIVAALGLDHSATVLDMGCGTGAFAIHAAPYYRRIYAVDVAGAMLNRARRKAKKAGLINIEFRRGGFLTYEHTDEPADAAVSAVALHHLPDFWKLVGLHRLASMLKPDGRLYLIDVVFSFDVDRHASSIERFVERMSVRTTPDGRRPAQTHVREEYSTCGWIMEGLLERAGFRIDDTDYKDDFLAAYLCTKKPEPATVEGLTAATRQVRWSGS